MAGEAEVTSRTLLTPCQEHFVHARLVYAGTTNPIHDECDGGNR